VKRCDGGAQSTRRAPSVLLIPSTQRCCPTQCRRHAPSATRWFGRRLAWPTGLSAGPAPLQGGQEGWTLRLQRDTLASSQRSCRGQLSAEVGMLSRLLVLQALGWAHSCHALMRLRCAHHMAPGRRAPIDERRLARAQEPWRTSIVVGHTCCPVQRRHGLTSLRWAAHASAMDYGGHSPPALPQQCYSSQLEALTRFAASPALVRHVAVVFRTVSVVLTTSSRHSPWCLPCRLLPARTHTRHRISSER
jgi:hypothetical protein